ncbi:MAG: hypothetical protein ACXVCP_08170 [Bdellovibrio sp.]
MKVAIEFEDSTQVQTELQFAEFTRANRLKKAWATFGAFLLAAVFSVFIPVLHFVLVPAFLISAFVMPIKQFDKVSYIDLTGYRCPKCGEPLNQKKVFQSKNDNFSRVYCYQCRTTMKFTGSNNS